MNHDDLQLLRTAALELQADGDDLVRVAGIVQRIKNWWKAWGDKGFRKRKDQVQESYQEVKGPLSDLIGQLSEIDKGFKNQDPETVSRLVNTIPGTIAQVTSGMDDLSQKMRAIESSVPVSYMDDKGNELSGDNLSWVRSGYRKNKELLQKLWDMLPPEFRNEVPVAQRVGRPINEFAWYQKFSPDQVVFSNSVLGDIENQFRDALKKAGFPQVEIDRVVQTGFGDFINNLQYRLINEAIVDRVDFPHVSAKVANRPVNQMMLTMEPGWVPVPAGSVELQANIGFVKMNDLSVAKRGRDQISVFLVRTIRLEPTAFQKYQTTNENLLEFHQEEAEWEDAEPLIIEESGPIAKIVKRAIWREKLPLTQAVVKIAGQTFHHKARFAKVLSSALRQEIDAECSVRHDNNDIEVQVNVRGSKFASVPAIYGISMDVADQFVQAAKVGVHVDVEPGLSKLGLIDSDVLNQSFRKVAFETLERRLSWR